MAECQHNWRLQGEALMYEFRTARGIFRIKARSDGRWVLMFEDDPLGPYATPEQAADDAACGSCHWPSEGFDPGSCGIPADLAEWTCLRR